jgi:energy-coupling factor transport system permease protein
MKYQPGQSMVHRLHPLLKLGWLLWLTVAVFAFESPPLPVIVVVCAVLLLWGSGVAPWRIPGVRVWAAVGTLLLVTHALSDREGAAIIGPLTANGLGAGVRAAGRLLAVMSLSTLFVTTTEPVSLVCALVNMGLPYRWGFALMTALRLAPVFRVEAHHVYRAQMVRGVAYDGPAFRRWWAMAKYLCFPLLVSALRSAHSLSLSMEGRAFGLYRRRTYMREVKVGRLDVVAGLSLALSMLVAVVYALGYFSL